MSSDPARSCGCLAVYGNCLVGTHNVTKMVELLSFQMISKIGDAKWVGVVPVDIVAQGSAESSPVLRSTSTSCAAKAR
jgi:hypothetical protein